MAGLLIYLVFLCPNVHANEAFAAEVRSWDAGGEYRAPDFNDHFSDSVAGTAALADWWDGAEREEHSATEVAALLRHGLRRYDGDRGALLRWAGRRFITASGEQSPMLMELMYHASDARAPADLRGPAIRFGLTAVRPMTPNILSALAALSMASEEADELDRIASGIGAQREDALRALATYLESTDSLVRAKATLVKQLWTLELKAHDWAQAHRREQIEATFREQLPAIRNSLRAGTSSERRTTLEWIVEHDILSIAPDSALAWLAPCAKDQDAVVRALAARLIGEKWVLNAPQQDPVAVDLALRLGADEDRAVRHNAVYYGLSVVSPKNDAVILRLIEVASLESPGELSERIAWGLRAYQSQVRALLNDWIDAEERTRSETGRRLQQYLVE
jgi:hypothetical protein